MAFLTFLILGCLVTFSAGVGPELPVCDQDVIGKIYQYWLRNGGAPKGILDTRPELEFAYGSTVTYFTYDTVCTYYKNYSPENGLHRTVIYLYYNDRAPTMAGVTSYEQDGVTRFDDDGMRFYILFEHGVSCIYTCSNGPNAIAHLPHAAVIKMSKNRPDLGAADKCVNLLNSWGISITRFYSDSCAENADNAPTHDQHGEGRGIGSNRYQHQS